MTTFSVVCLLLIAASLVSSWERQQEIVLHTEDDDDGTVGPGRETTPEESLFFSVPMSPNSYVYPHQDLKNLSSAARRRWVLMWTSVSLMWWVVVLVNAVFFLFVACICIPSSACRCSSAECSWLAKRRCCTRGLRFVVSLQVVSMFSAMSMCMAVFISPRISGKMVGCRLQGWLVEQSFIWKFSLLMGFGIYVLVMELLKYAKCCACCGYQSRSGREDDDPEKLVFAPGGIGDPGVSSDEDFGDDEQISLNYGYRDPAEAYATGWAFSRKCCLQLVAEIFIQLAAFLFATMLGSIALGLRLYDRVQYWCWIRYGPTWGCWAIVFLLYLFLFGWFLCRNGYWCCCRRDGDSCCVGLSKDACKKIGSEFMKKAMYPLSPIAIWFWPSLNRIVYWSFHGPAEHVFFLQLLTLDFSPLFGVVNFVYFLLWLAWNRNVREKQNVQDLCLVCCCRHPRREPLSERPPMEHDLYGDAIPDDRMMVMRRGLGDPQARKLGRDAPLDIPGYSDDESDEGNG